MKVRISPPYSRANSSSLSRACKELVFIYQKTKTEVRTNHFYWGELLFENYISYSNKNAPSPFPVSPGNRGGWRRHFDASCDHNQFLNGNGFLVGGYVLHTLTIYAVHRLLPAAVFERWLTRCNSSIYPPDHTSSPSPESRARRYANMIISYTNLIARRERLSTLIHKPGVEFQTPV
jgi:hypothetical protein